MDAIIFIAAECVFLAVIWSLLRMAKSSEEGGKWDA